jgi:hypothetical protein
MMMSGQTFRWFWALFFYLDKDEIPCGYNGDKCHEALILARIVIVFRQRNLDDREIDLTKLMGKWIVPIIRQKEEARKRMRCDC